MKLSARQEITYLLWLGAAFMFGEFLYHLSGVRLIGVSQTWPESAVAFARFFMLLWASASLFITLTLLYVARSPEKHRLFFPWLTAFSLFHAALLGYLSLQRFPEIMPNAAQYIWNPWYSWQVKVEAGALALAAFRIWQLHKKLAV